MTSLEQALTFSTSAATMTKLKRKQDKDAASLALSMAKPAITFSFGSIAMMLAAALWIC